MPCVQPHLSILTCLEYGNPNDIDRLNAMLAMLSNAHELTQMLDWQSAQWCLASLDGVTRQDFNDCGIHRFSRLVEDQQTRIRFVLDVMESADSVRPSDAWMISGLPVLALMPTEDRAAKESVSLSVYAPRGMSNPMCALSLEDAAELLPFHCTVLTDPGVAASCRLIAAEPCCAAYIKAGGGNDFERADALLNVIRKAGEILMRRWDVAMAYAHGRLV